MNKLEALFRSRRFWIAIAAVGVVALSELGIDADPQAIEGLVLLAASWIVGDSLRKTE